MTARPQLSWRRLLRLVGYTCLFAGIGLVTVLLVAIGRGYRIDLKTGEIIGGGLLIVDSTPADATVLVDGKTQKHSAPMRLSLKAGNYQLELQRDGYQPWQKEVSIAVGRVTRIPYPLLLPTKGEATGITTLNEPVQFVQSPNRRQLAWVSRTGGWQVMTMAIGTNQPTVVYRLPANLGVTAITQLSWGPDVRNLLLKANTPAGSRYFLIRIADGTAQDLTAMTKLDWAELRFSDTSDTNLVGLVGAGLRRFDSTRNSLSPVLATKVSFIMPKENNLYLVQAVGNGQQVVRLDRDDQPHVIVGNLESASYSLNYAAYGDQRHLVLLDQTKQLVSLYDPLSESQQTRARFDTVSASTVTVSPDGRFLVMSNGAVGATHDFDEGRLWRWRLDGVPQSAFNWYDNFHLLTTIAGRLTIVEFDGQNAQALAKVRSGFTSYASRNGSQVFCLTGSVRASTLTVLTLPTD
ncbi:PEGA domain-containing protein [Candidatus Microgenomates bacterium]|nr:PEGA domain-containing protein [Candidatus Microgenomates bacterium]